MLIQQQQLHQVLNLVQCANPQEWEKFYYTMLRQKVLSEKDEFPLFDYEYRKRKLLYAFSHDAIARNAPIDFFEFGVYKGDSFRQWMEVNTHPESRFFGFDCFEGLPEDWHTGNKAKGHFSTGGAIPETDDPRASFIKGLFNESLRPFLDSYERKNRLVIHIDADLCSSSLYALMTMDPIIKRGTLIVFDDFNPADEFAALYHYANSCGREWQVVAARRDLVKLAVVITG